MPVALMYMHRKIEPASKESWI